MTTAAVLSKRLSEFPILTTLSGDEDLPLVSNGTQHRVKTNQFISSTSNNGHPGLDGSLSIYNNQVTNYSITAFDMNNPVTVTSNQGTVVQTGNTFTLNPGNFVGSLTLTIGTQTYAVDVLASIVQIPTYVSQTSPVTASILPFPIFLSTFATVGLADTLGQVNWQIDTVNTFNSANLINSTDTTSWSVSNGVLTVNVLDMTHTVPNYFFRVRYAGTVLGYSGWSQTLSITTSLPDVPSVQIASLLNPSAVVDPNYGNSISMNAAGTIVAIGSLNSNSNVGSVYIFTKSGFTWTLAQTLSATPGLYSYIYGFGQSVAMNSAGTVLAVGSYMDGTSSTNTGLGSVYIFELVSGTWTQMANLAGSDKTNIVQFGWSVSINKAGTAVVVGAPNEATTGVTYVIVNNAGTWTVRDRIPGGAGTLRFGHASAIDDTITNLLIGAPNTTGPLSTVTGAVLYYTYSASAWTLHQTLTDETITNAFYGSALSLSDDATLLAVGAQDGGTYMLTGSSPSGAVYLYTFAAGTWTNSQKIIGDSIGSSLFGWAVALSGNKNTLLVSAPSQGLNSAGGALGAVLVYKNNGSNTFTKNSEFLGNFTTDGSFGNGLAISDLGDTAFIDSPGNSTGNVETVYYYA